MQDHGYRQICEHLLQMNDNNSCTQILCAFLKLYFEKTKQSNNKQ